MNPRKSKKTYRPRVCVAYTYYEGKVHHSFMTSMITMMRLDQRAAGGRGLFEVGMGRVVGSTSAYIPQARNMLCHEFLKQDHEWLLFLDHDIRFHTLDLYRLLDVAKLKQARIMGGMYFINLNDTLCPVFFVPRETPDGTSGGGPLLEFHLKKVYELWATGMGFTLIHRSALEEMRDSGKWPADHDGAWTWFGHDAAENGQTLGEDLTFCLRAAGLGIKTYGYTGVVLGHAKSVEYNLELFASRPGALVEDTNISSELIINDGDFLAEEL